MNQKSITKSAPFNCAVATILAAASLITSAAHAVVLPVAEDTSSSAAGKLALPAGKSTVLGISKTATAATRAYLDFNVGATGLDPNAVVQARLKLYFPAVTTPGALEISAAAADWHEGVAGNAPASVGVPANIPLASVKSKQFVLVDVTSVVKTWLTTPANDFGFAIQAPNATTRVKLGAKEGSGSGYPAELELDLTTDVGQIGAANLDPAFVATLPTLAQANTFTGTNTFTFGSGARTVSIQDDSSQLAPVLNVGGSGVNVGKLRLRNALHVFPSDDGTRGSEILLHDNAGVSTIGLFGANGGSISAGGIEANILGIGGTNARADFTFFNGGPAKLFTIQGGADLTPELVVNDADRGTMRVRSNLEIWPNAAGTVQGQFNVRAKNGGITISGDGETGEMQVGALLATSAQITTTLDADIVLANGVTSTFVTASLNSIADKYFTIRLHDGDIAAGATLTPTGSYMRLTAAGGTAKSLSALTAIADGGNVGATLILQGTSDTATITIFDNANTQLNGNTSRVLGANDTLTLIWDGFNWIETAFSNN
jgi:hypothetical protein